MWKFNLFRIMEFKIIERGNVEKIKTVCDELEAEGYEIIYPLSVFGSHSDLTSCLVHYYKKAKRGKKR